MLCHVIAHEINNLVLGACRLSSRVHESCPGVSLTDEKWQASQVRMSTRHGRACTPASYAVVTAVAVPSRKNGARQVALAGSVQQAGEAPTRADPPAFDVQGREPRAGLPAPLLE